jgi:hypothetical protein
MFNRFGILRAEGEVSSAAIASTTPQFTNAASVFDAAKDLFKDDAASVTDDVEADNFDAEEPNGENGEQNFEEPLGEEAQLQPNEQPAKPQFSPISYKGKVFGEDVAQEFKTQKELDSALQKSFAAQHLYTAHKNLKQQMAELEPDANFGRDVIAMAKQTPKDLLNLLRDDLIPEEVLAEWVHEEFMRFSKVAKMTPEQRDYEKRLKEAERIIEERQYLEQENKKLSEQRRLAAEEAEKKEFNLWHQSEMAKWTAKVPEEYREAVNKAMRNVVSWAKVQLDSGKSLTTRELSKELEVILKPYTFAKNPAQQRREAGKATEQRRNAATSALQGVTGAAQRQAQTPQQSGPKTAADVFDWAQKRVAQGASKLRS